MLLWLQGELDARPWRRLGLDGVADLVRRVTDDHDDPVHPEFDEGVDDVEHHGPTADPVERLGQGRPHARTLAGGEDDGAQLRGHGFISSSRTAV